MKKYLLILVCASFFIFLNSLNNDFIFDDDMLTVNSPVVVDGSFTDLLQTYRPIRFITYAFDYHFIGKDPWAFRIMNVFYHVCTTLAVFWFFLLLGLKKRNAFIGALLFAIHPIHVDAVAYISGRRDVLTALFYVLSLSFFVKFYKAFKIKDKKNYLFLALSIVTMFLSYFSKEMGATIPLAWLLIVYYFERNKMFKTAWFWAMSMIVFAIFSVAALYTIQQGGSSFTTLHSLSFHGNNPITHYLTALTLPIYYIKQTLFPFHLILDNSNYSLITVFSFKLLFSIFGIILYLSIVAVLIKKAGKFKALDFNRYSFYSFMLLFFVLTLAPVLQIIPLHEIVAEHYLYLPSMAFCGIAGNIFGNAYEKLTAQNDSPRPVALAFMILFLTVTIFFTWKTITRNIEMNNWFTVLDSDAKIKPLSYRGLYTMATVYFSLNMPDEAFKYLTKANIEVEKIGALTLDDIVTNFATFYGLKGNIEEALNIYNTYPDKSIIPEKIKIIAGYINIAKGNCDKAVEIQKTMNDYDLNIRNSKNAISLCIESKEDTVLREKIVEECFNDDLCIAKKLGEKGKIIKAFEYIKLAKQKSPENIVNILKEHLKLSFKLPSLSTFVKSDIRNIIKDPSISETDRIYFTHELATLDLKSDIPEALEYYKLEKELRFKSSMNIPPILDKSIEVLSKYVDDVLVEHKYYKLNF